jgi:plasmid maintenance system antidote protein VapI
MYNIKTDLIKDLKGGRTARYIAEILDVTESYISMIFNSKTKCTKIVAMGLISIKHNISLDNSEMEELLQRYFIKS